MQKSGIEEFKVCCSECAAWEGIATNTNDSIGVCRRHSPVIINGVATWPKVKQTEWCLDFLPIPDFDSLREELQEVFYNDSNIH